jgi:hypothetical protein
MAVANTLIGTHNQSGLVELQFHAPAHAAATATELFALGSVPHAFYVKYVYHQPSAAITGDDTNYTSLEVLEMAVEKCNIDYVTSTDATADTRTTLSATAWTIAAGALLQLQYTKAANGVAVPDGAIIFQGEWR